MKAITNKLDSKMQTIEDEFYHNNKEAIYSAVRQSVTDGIHSQVVLSVYDSVKEQVIKRVSNEKEY